MADSRKYFPVNHFAGVVKSYHPRAIPDDKVSDVLNVLFEFGKAKRRYGYNAIGANTPLDGIIMDIVYYEQLRTGDNFTVVLTTTSAYSYDSSTGRFEDITPFYNTGIASADGTAITGTGSSWDTGWLGSGVRIKFGTNDPSVNSIAVTGNTGAQWTERTGSGSRNWYSIASSSDGVKLVASVIGGQIYTSTDSGANWVARDSNRSWTGVASSSDGVKLVACVLGSGQIYTSTDSGANWVARDSNRSWTGVASSSDGVKLVACATGSGQIYTSTDSGANWVARDSNRNWLGVASSSDGAKLAAVVYGGQIYTSTDSGANWVARDSNRSWYSISSSSDGVKLVASVYGGQIYTSTDSGANWVARDSNRSWLGVASSSDGVGLIACVYSGGVYTSTDSGANWVVQSSMGLGLWYGATSSSDGLKMAICGYSKNIWTCVSNLTLIGSVSSLVGIFVGCPISGTGITVGSRIKAINWVTSAITPDIPPTESGTGTTFTIDISPWYHIATVGSTVALTIDALGTTTGDTTSGSAVVINIPDTSTLYVGEGVDGTGIAAETSILSIDSATQITLSKNATATNAGVTLTFGILIEAAHDVNYVLKTCFTGDADNLFSYCMPYSDTIDDKILVFTNGVDKIKKWDGSGAISDLTMTGITCDWAKCVGYFGSSLSEHTIIANMNDGSTNLPHQIMVSDAGDPEAYSGAYYELLTSNDEITALKALGTRLVIYKRKSISLAWATPEGGNDDPLDLDQNKITEVGCPAPRTIQDFGSYHLFLGLSGDSVNVYAFNGINVETIGSDIYADLKSKVRLSMVHRSFAFTLQSRSLYCLFVPTGTSDYPDLVYVFNYVEKHWTIWEFTDMMMAYGFMRQEYNPTWAEIHTATTLWPAMEMRWADLKFYSQDAFPLVGDAAGYVYDFRDIYDDDNSVDIDAFFVTKDFPLNDPRHTFKLLEGVVGYKGQEDGNDIQFQASVDFGNNYCDPITIEQDTSTDVADVHDHEYAETICNFYEKGRQARFKLNNVDGADFEIEGIIIGYTDEQGLTK